MAGMLFGNAWSYVVGAIISISCFGAAIGYITAISGFLYPIITNTPNAPQYLNTDSGNRPLTGVIWFVSMVAVVILKWVNSIRYVSAVGVTMVMYFVIVIFLVVHSCLNSLPRGMRGDMKFFDSGNRAIYGLSNCCLCLHDSVYRTQYTPINATSPTRSNSSHVPV